MNFSSLQTIISKLTSHTSQKAIGESFFLALSKSFQNNPDSELPPLIQSYLENRYNHLVFSERSLSSFSKGESLSHLKKTAEHVGLSWPEEMSLDASDSLNASSEK